MKIIHIVSSIAKINYGVWNAAIFGSTYLNKKHQVTSELWICSKIIPDETVPDIEYHFFEKDNLTFSGYNKWLRKFNPSDTIFVTHGAWLKPTRLGFKAKLKGYSWIYIPHGMHEPWVDERGKLKKMIYFKLLERPMARRADAVRAVSDVEKNNLTRRLNRKIHTIYNGIILDEDTNIEKPPEKLNFLFMARLHRKKGIEPLVKAWAEVMLEKKNAQLIIVGPDEGELDKIKPYFNNNITYLGPQFGQKKQFLLREAHFYILPSFKEGFPTSVVEAMGYGAIPIVSIGCNFPQVFEANLGFEVKPDKVSIQTVLKQIITQPFDLNLSGRNIEYVKQNLTDKIIGENLFMLYQKILDKRNNMNEKSQE